MDISLNKKEKSSYKIGFKLREDIKSEMVLARLTSMIL